jgi:hypothetical protein
MKTKQTDTRTFQSIDSAQLDAVLGGCGCGCGQASCACAGGNCQYGAARSRFGWRR